MYISHANKTLWIQSELVKSNELSLKLEIASKGIKESVRKNRKEQERERGLSRKNGPIDPLLLKQISVH